jgi:hypothetical protein
MSAYQLAYLSKVLLNRSESRSSIPLPFPTERRPFCRPFSMDPDQVIEDWFSTSGIALESAFPTHDC